MAIRYIDMPYREFGDWMKGLRVRAGLSPRVAMERTNGRIPETALARAELGSQAAIMEIVADVATVKALLQVYGLDPSEPEYQRFLRVSDHAPVLLNAHGPVVDRVVAALNAVGPAGEGVTLPDMLTVLAHAQELSSRD
jgi:hypothetical protein